MVGMLCPEPLSRYDMSRNSYVPKRCCPETVMSRHGAVPKRSCPETVMSRNGYVPKWLCPEVARSRSGYVPNWLCPELARSRNVRRPLTVVSVERRPTLISPALATHTHRLNTYSFKQNTRFSGIQTKNTRAVQHIMM